MPDSATLPLHSVCRCCRRHQGYPCKKLLSIVAAVRFIRFFIEAALAVFYRRHILALAESPVVRYVVIILIVIALGLSGFSIFRWIQKARTSGRTPRRNHKSP